MTTTRNHNSISNSHLTPPCLSQDDKAKLTTPTYKEQKMEKFLVDKKKKKQSSYFFVSFIDCHSSYFLICVVLQQRKEFNQAYK